MEPNLDMAAGGRIFILDIGTRSVVGIAGHKQGDIFVVEACDMEPHSRRAMIDGQIEDIEQVAKVAGLVKERIEEKLGCVFRQVSVAAAGRALKTHRATTTAELPAGVTITAQTAWNLENDAINHARMELDAQRGDVPYYCVGHSVVRYLLDGYPFTTIVGHQAACAEVEIIATFLPAEVVESLRRCMELLNLEIDTMTLEPIAAMRAVIPQDLRLLNLGLVDIGAGTSDIALSADSSVSGYTMATVAGDEVTETLIRKYLVDFATAERLKLALESGGPFEFTDILGFTHETSEAEMLETIKPAIETVAQVIADKITECNGGAPAAVFMVGGGSKTPGLCQALAEKLALPHDKVALAGTNFSGRLLNENSGLDGPEFATPVGIALIAAENAEIEGASVTVNGRRVRLFTSIATSMTDALLMAGYTYSDLMGRNGRSLTFTLNGVRTVVRGGLYTPAELTVNGKPASLTTPVESGDAIEITPAASGEDAVAEVADYAQGERPIRVKLNGNTLLAGLIARINGTVATPDTPILELDQVELYIVRTVGELCEAAGMDAETATLAVNGQGATPATFLKDADVVTCTPTGGSTTPPAPQTAAEKAGGTAAPLPKPSVQRLQPERAGQPPTAPAASPTVKPDVSVVAPAPITPVAGPAAARAETPAPAASPAPAAKAQTQTEAPAPAKPTPAPAAAPARPAFGAPAATPIPDAKAAPGTQPGATAAEAKTEPAADTSTKVKPGISAGTAPVSPSVFGAKAAPVPAAPAASPATARAETLAPAKAEAKTEEPAPVKPAQEPAAPASTPAPPEPAPAAEEAADPKTETAPPAKPAGSRSLRIDLNGRMVVLPPKPDGEPHRLFDLLPMVDIDPANPKGMVKVLVNGKDAPYLEELVTGDVVKIGWDEG